MELSNRERAHFLEMMQRSLTEFVLPELESQKARDVGRLLADMLDQLALEAGEGAALSERYLAGARPALHHAYELLSGDAANADICSRIRSALDGEQSAADQLLNWRAVSGDASKALYTQRDKTPAALAVVRELVQVDHDFQQVTSRRHLAAHEPKDVVVKKTLAPTLKPDAVTNYLRNKFPELPQLVVREILPLAGGRSKETLLLKIDHGVPRFPAEVVMRRDLVASINSGSVIEEYPLIRAVYDVGGVPMPEPYFAEANAELLGGAFVLMQKVDGDKIGDFFPEVQTPDCDLRALGEQEAKILARLHSIDPAVVENIRIVGKQPDLRAQIIRDLELVWERATVMGADSPPSVAFETAFRWLHDHLDYGLIGPVCFLHGDLGLHNQLVKAGVVTAVLDWELPSIGPAAKELGYCKQVFSQLLPWDEFVRVYQANGGSAAACDPKAVIFHRLNVMVTGFSYTKQIRHMLRHGVTQDITHGHAGYLANLYGENSLTAALLDALALSD